MPANILACSEKQIPLKVKNRPVAIVSDLLAEICYINIFTNNNIYRIEDIKVLQHLPYRFTHNNNEIV